MLFEMLAGQRPFSGTISQTVQAIITAPLPDLEVLAPDAPIALVDLVYRMLNRDPQARISSVRYIGAELEDILQGRAKQSRFETPVPDFRSRPKHNLPVQTTPFVGREAELVEVARLLENPSIRLLSIIAQGGMGKTRLSLEAAERAIPYFGHGVYFVELAPLHESSSIIPTVAQALSYQFQNDGREPKQQICDFLQAKELLLMMDNFEHLLDGAGLVSDLLKAAPKLKILVTSRQRLDQQGETLFHLSGMDFPAWETPEDALEYAAVKLFMNSATRAKPDFELRADNLDAVARICKLVQGMPLGIVLAASWLGMLSPEEIAAELQKGLDFLETDSQQLPERQRSMRAVMDYSWQQMSEAEQAVFAKLSVFRGGFTREAAEAVAGANLRILMSLVNKSLLHRDTTTGRYEIHELLRQYAQNHLKGLPIELASTQTHHSAYYSEFLSKNWTHLRSPMLRSAANEIDLEFENVGLAWRYMISTDMIVEIRKSIFGFWWFLLLRNRNDEGVELFGLELGFRNHISDADENLWLGASLRAAQGWFYGNRGQQPYAKELAQDCLQHLPVEQYPKERYLALTTLAQACANMGQSAEATQAAQEMYDIAKNINDSFFHATACFYLGLASSGGDVAQSKAYLLESLTVATQIGDSFSRGSILRGLGHIASLEGDLNQAMKLLNEAIELINEAGQLYMLGFTRRGIARTAFLLNQYAEARHQLIESLRLYEQNGQKWEALNTLIELATLLAKENQHIYAVELLSLVQNHPTTLAYFRNTAETTLNQLQSEMPDETFIAAYERGKSLDLETVVRQILSESA
jgi:predicted ATPase/tetratricopeptide (TPR) repeat protein